MQVLEYYEESVSPAFEREIQRTFLQRLSPLGGDYDELQGTGRRAKDNMVI